MVTGDFMKTDRFTSLSGQDLQISEPLKMLGRKLNLGLAISFSALISQGLCLLSLNATEGKIFLSIEIFP